MKIIIQVTLASMALCVSFPALAAEADPTTTQLLMQKGKTYQLEVRTCENGRHPIIMAHRAEASAGKGLAITNSEHFYKNRPSQFTFEVDEDTRGVVAQFCNPRNISPYFKALKARMAGSSAQN